MSTVLRNMKSASRRHGHVMACAFASLLTVIVLCNIWPSFAQNDISDDNVNACERSSIEDMLCVQYFELPEQIPGQKRFFTINWKYDKDESLLKVVMQADSSGWISMGFAKYPQSMFGANSIVGYVQEGIATVEPYVLNGYSVAQVIETTDIQLSNTHGTETLTGDTENTAIGFTMPVDNNEIINPDQPVDIIFALGTTDTFDYHGFFNKGYGKLDLRLEPPSLESTAIEVDVPSSESPYSESPTAEIPQSDPTINAEESPTPEEALSPAGTENVVIEAPTLESPVSEIPYSESSTSDYATEDEKSPTLEEISAPTKIENSDERPETPSADDLMAREISITATTPEVEKSPPMADSIEDDMKSETDSPSPVGRISEQSQETTQPLAIPESDTSDSNVISSLATSRGLEMSTIVTLPSGDEMIISWGVIADEISFGIQANVVDEWIGIGFPKNGGTMIGALSVIGSINDGIGNVESYVLNGYTLNDIQPAGSSFPLTERLAEKTTGPVSRRRARALLTQTESTYIEFKTPLSSLGMNSTSLMNSFPVDVIYAIGSSSALDYHGPFGRGAAQVDLSTGLSKEKSIEGGTAQQRYNHGILMWTAWGALIPLGIGFGKLIRFTKSKFVLYLHIFCQTSGISIATAGFIIAMVDFKDYTNTPFHHGQLGIAVMALAYFQFVNGLLRPHAVHDREEITIWTTARYVWEYIHSLSGIAITAIAVVNSLLGIYILSDYFMEVSFSNWFAGFVTTVSIALVLVYLVGRVCYNRLEQDILELEDIASNKDEETGNIEMNGLPISLPPEMVPQKQSEL